MKIAMIFISITLFSTFNLLANNIASITALRGNAEIQREGTSHEASLGSKLKQRDSILTKSDTKVQVIFQDETVVSIGKNSNFSIEEYFF